jgi:O-antigen ligase
MPDPGATALRLEPDDLLDLLRPRVLLPALGVSLLFGLLTLYAHAGAAILLLLSVAGVILALLSPSAGFALCVFLFAFRNDAFALAGQKAGDPLFAVLALSWLVHALLAGRLQLHRAYVPVGLFALTCLLSGIPAHYGNWFLLDLVRVFYLLVIFLVGTQVLGRRTAFLLAVKAFLAAGLVMAVCQFLGALDVLLLHRSGVPFVDSGGRFGFQSIAVDPLRVSSFMLFPLLVVAGLQQRAPAGHPRNLATALFWLGVVACGLSFSRSVLLQLLPGLLILWLLTSHHLKKLLLITGVVGGGLLAVSLLPQDAEWVQKYGLHRWAVAGKLAQMRTEPRLIIWQASWQAFRQNPVLGIGLDNFQPRYFEYRDPWLARGWIYWNVKANHNTYLASLVETGVVGFAALMGMIVFFLGLGRRVVRLARAEGDLPRYLLAVAALAALVGQIVAGVALELFTHNHVWVLMALLVVLDRPKRQADQSLQETASEL